MVFCWGFGFGESPALVLFVWFWCGLLCVFLCGGGLVDVIVCRVCGKEITKENFWIHRHDCYEAR